MQVLMKCFLLNREKNFGADTFSRFREKRKKGTFNSKKLSHLAEGYATLITS